MPSGKCHFLEHEHRDDRTRDKNYNINITKQRQRVVTKDKILYKYGSDGIHIFENDHYILVNSKDIIDTIVCITKNNII